MRLITITALLASTAISAHATTKESIIFEMGQQGCTKVQVSNTFFGNQKLTCVEGGVDRVVVISSNGNVLRDDGDEYTDPRFDPNNDPNFDPNDDNYNDAADAELEAEYLASQGENYVDEDDRGGDTDDVVTESSFDPNNDPDFDPNDDNYNDEEDAELEKAYLAAQGENYVDEDDRPGGDTDDNDEGDFDDGVDND